MWTEPSRVDEPNWIFFSWSDWKWFFWSGFTSYMGISESIQVKNLIGPDLALLSHVGLSLRDDYMSLKFNTQVTEVVLISSPKNQFDSTGTRLLIAGAAKLVTTNGWILLRHAMDNKGIGNLFWRLFLRQYTDWMTFNSSSRTTTADLSTHLGMLGKV